MKKILSVALMALIFSHPLALSTVSVSAQESVQIRLTNQDVIEMNKAGMSEPIILAKINASPTNFDTSPNTLQELKKAGLSDAIILAMVQPAKSAAPQAENAPVSVSVNPVDMAVPDGTEIEVQLKNNLSGEEAKMGEVVDFTVVRDVQVNGVTVITQGASAIGRITKAKKAGRWGRTGKLEWAMQDVQTVNNVRIPVRFTKAMIGGSKGGTVAVAAVATTILLGPVGLLWGLKKGKKAEIAAGNKYTIYTDGNSNLRANASSVNP